MSTSQSPTAAVTTPSLPLSSSCRASQFKATVLWRNLVAYIYRNVKQKRRRLILKGVGPTSCFSGSDVCDTALLYLLMDNDNFKTADLTRIKAKKLCQLLLESQVFEPLSGSTSTQEKRFDDRSNKYYKFAPSIDADFQQKFNPAAAASVTSADSGISSPTNERLQSENKSPVIEGVLCNPSPGPSSKLDCGGHIMKELLGLTSTESTNGSALKDTNGKHRTATGYIRRMYNEHVLMNKRTSLDCEGVFNHGVLPRNISAGTGITGVFKRKWSALDLAGGSQDGGVESFADVRRSMRLRKASAEPLAAKKASLHTRNVLNTDKTPSVSTTASHTQHKVQPTISSRSNDYLYDEESGGVVIERQPSALADCKQEAQSNESSSSKTVEKLARLTGDVIFSPSAIAEIRKEIALSQLSQLIDLPILEGLVCTGSSNSKDSSGYDNSVFFNVDTPNSMAMGLSASDTWVRTAIDVFDFMPDGHRTKFDYQIGLNPSEYKMALYRSILKSYRSRTEPLFPACHEQIHVAMLSMIMSGEEQKAVLTMRLATMLLPCYLMAELSTLLEFLQAVSVTSDPKLKPSLNNNDIVLNDFSAVFLGCKILSMDQRRMLLLFMMRYCDKLSQVPQSVQSTLEKTMQNIKQGDDTPTPSTIFCKQLSSEQYEQQQQQTTEKAIVELIKSVIDDTGIPLKDKHKHIKQFSKHYSDIMAKHFGDIA